MAQHFDVIVVGAGMVGATFARALADTRLKVALLDAMPLDAQPQPVVTTSGYDPRVSAVSVASEHIFRHLDVWSRIPGQSRCAYRNMHVWDGEGTGSISFDAYESSQSRLGHIVENHRIQQALLESLQVTAVTRIGGKGVVGLVREDTGWRLTLEDEEHVHAPLIVAADGARSKVRELAGFAMREWDYLHHAVVTTIRTERPHQSTAWQRFLPSGPLAFLPLNDRDQGHYCSIVWSVLPEVGAEVMALEEPEFLLRLEQAFEGRLGRILGADRRHVIPLRQRHAKHYAMPGLVLIGDAAHSIHPLAGQGVNLGLLDAAELFDVLSAALQRGEQWASLEVLRRYERRRMGANLGMMAAMEGFERLFHADALPLRWIRNTGMRLLDRQGAVKAGIMRQAMGVSGRLPSLALDPVLNEAS